MSSNIKVGDTIRVTVSFLDFDPTQGEEVLVDPVAVNVYVYLYDSVTSQFNLLVDERTVDKQSFGIYYYDWTTTEAGRFKVKFEGSLANDSVIENERVFYIGSVQPSIVLGQINPINFLGELDPIYLDPEIILNYFPAGDLVEITELINWYSSEAYDLFYPTAVHVSPLLQDYIFSSVMCDLSKIHIFEGGLAGFEGAQEFTLGDLHIRKSHLQSVSTSDKINRGTATTWCELAAILREELTFRKTNIKTVVKGSNWENPIPERKLKNYDGSYFQSRIRS
jgi:hypothetical protein